MLTFAVGDIHGCYGKLADLIGQCFRYAGDRPHRYIFLGDYIDRGPKSRQVVEFILNLEAALPNRILCLKGNHEDMLINAIRNSAARAHWLANGGNATLDSYGVDVPGDLPASHVRWFSNRRLMFDDGIRLYVHAGIDPRRPFDCQHAQDVLWIREPFLSFKEGFERLIVHGHTPTADGRPDLRSNRLNLDTGAVLGRSLFAAVFTETEREPTSFLQSGA